MKSTRLIAALAAGTFLGWIAESIFKLGADDRVREIIISILHAGGIEAVMFGAVFGAMIGSFVGGIVGASILSSNRLHPLSASKRGGIAGLLFGAAVWWGISESNGPIVWSDHLALGGAIIGNAVVWWAEF